MEERIVLTEECLIFCDQRPIVVIEENKRKYQGNNYHKKLLAQYRVDGCLIKCNKRCDFLLLNIKEKTAFFIELKGKDLLAATEQMNCSIDLLSDALNGYKINVRIVLSKTTLDFRSSQYLRLMRRIKKLNGTIIQKSSVIEEEL